MKKRYGLAATAFAAAAVIFTAFFPGEIPVDVKESAATAMETEFPIDMNVKQETVLEDSRVSCTDPDSGSSSFPDNTESQSSAVFDNEIGNENRVPEETAPAASPEPTDEEITDFAKKIQRAFTEENLEALAELCGYPVYISIPDGGGFEIGTEAELLQLAAEQVFTDKLKESVNQARLDSLEIYGAGVILGDEQSIVFNKVEGVMMITGIHP